MSFPKGHRVSVENDIENQSKTHTEMSLRFRDNNKIFIRIQTRDVTNDIITVRR